MSDEIDSLHERVAAEPGHRDFPLLVEAMRRQGRLRDALEVAAAGMEHAPDRPEGRLALALVLLDLGDADAARRELAEGIETLPGAEILRAAHTALEESFRDDVGSEEIEAAFDEAESDPSEMVSANDIAERALEDAITSPEASVPAGFDAADHPSFATETMAQLLERQGDRDNAEAIRAAIEPDTLPLDAAESPASLIAAPDVGVVGDSHRERIVATLESWLHNLRRRAQ